MSPSAQDTDFLRFTESFVHRMLALSPVGAAATGYHRHTDASAGQTVVLDELLDDFSAPGLAHRRAVLRSLRSELAAYPPEKLDAAADVDRAIMEGTLDEAEFDLEHIQAYRHNPTVYANLLGYAIFQPMVQEYAPLEVRMGHILSRMDRLPAFLTAARTNLVDTDPVYTQAAVDSMHGNISLIENQLKQLVKQTASAALQQRYADTAPKSLAELNGFVRYLQEDLAKRSTGTWRLGPELYPAKLRYALGTGLTPREILRRAESALAQQRAEMLRLAEPLHRGYFPAHGDHAELTGKKRENVILREVLSGIAEVHPARNALLEEARANLAELRLFLREKQLLTMPARDNLTVIETPPFIRSSYGVGGFAPAPALEPQLGAYYWVTPIPEDWSAERAESKLREYNRFTFKILSIHEALPGHYVQFEHANSLEPPARRALRAVFASGPYAEGWAVYSEDLVLENGFLDGDPRLLLMHGKWMLRSISNAILDVRMHTMQMTDQQAMDMMMNDTYQERAEAEQKLLRAKLSSTQLPTYFVGWVEWHSLRDDVRRAEGSKFDLKRFHDRALDVGPIPMTELRRVMLPASGASLP
jgi:uncharacterized protein (DUF885 family)